MSYVRLDYKGKQVAAKLRKASKVGIDFATERCAEQAESSHWWRNRTGRLEASIVNEEAEETQTGARGRFGATKAAFWGLFLEKRTPFLRPALDTEARLLSKYIAAALKRGI